MSDDPLPLSTDGLTQYGVQNATMRVANERHDRTKAAKSMFHLVFAIFGYLPDSNAMSHSKLTTGSV